MQWVPILCVFNVKFQFLTCIQQIVRSTMRELRQEVAAAVVTVTGTAPVVAGLMPI